MRNAPADIDLTPTKCIRRDASPFIKQGSITEFDGLFGLTDTRRYEMRSRA